MKRTLTALLACLILLPPTWAEERRVIIVTPKGVWESVVVDGVPTQIKAINADVVVQGFGGPNTPAPNPPGDNDNDNTPAPTDPIINAVANLSKSILRDKDEAMAVHAIVNALKRNGVSTANFKQALGIALGVADSSIGADGRAEKWGKDVLKVTSDPDKILAGLKFAFSLESSSIRAIERASDDPDNPEYANAALDFMAILAIIKAIIDLLKTMGWI